MTDHPLTHQEDSSPSSSAVYFAPRYIFLNGPAGSGKTTLARLLQEVNPRLGLVDFPAPLWEAADALISEPTHLIPGCDYTDPDTKKVVLEDYSTRPTIRQVLVQLGHFARVAFGDDYLSRRAYLTCQSLSDMFDCFILPNARKMEDLWSFFSHCAPDEMLLLRIHRADTSWDGDLGDYLHPTPSRLRSEDIVNDGTLSELTARALRLISAATHGECRT